MVLARAVDLRTLLRYSFAFLCAQLMLALYINNVCCMDGGIDALEIKFRGGRYKTRRMAEATNTYSL